jgi:hypothetical protein
MTELGRFNHVEDDIVSGMIRDYTRRYGHLKPRLRREQYEQLASVVDETKEAQLEPADHTSPYWDLLMNGVRVLPFLVEDLQEQAQWWKIHMASMFADFTLGSPIDFPEEAKTSLDPARDRVIAWWQETGEAAYMLLDPILSRNEIPTRSWDK